MIHPYFPTIQEEFHNYSPDRIVSLFSILQMILKRLFSLFTLIFLLGSMIYASTGPRVNHRIAVVLESGVNYQAAFQALDEKAEIEIISWNPQTGIAELAADPRVTSSILSEALFSFKVKVISIAPIQP